MRASTYAALALLLISAGAVQAQDTHVVRPGETLWEISRQHMRTPLRWPELQRDNAVWVPQKLQPGQLLQLGGTGIAAVAELSGTAWLKRGDNAPQALRTGTPVLANDVLMTDRGAFLSLGLPDGSRLVIPSSSAVQVLAMNGRLTRLQLLNGRVEAHVEKQHDRDFEIRTRSIKLSVRGTHFRARDEDGIETAEVIKGSVAVSGDGQPALVLGAGSGALRDGTGALQARSLLPPPQRTADRTDWVTVTSIREARSYRLQLARDEDFLQIAYEARSADGTFARPPDLAAGFYHLRLTALDEQQLEGMPSDSAIYVAGGLSISTVRRMSDGRYEIRWPARPGQRYSFELARTPAFAPPLVNEPALFSGGVIVGPFEIPGPYHWRSRELTEGTDMPGAVNQGSFEVPAQTIKSR